MQTKLGVSYVLVTSAVVALAGAIFLMVVTPRLLSAADSGARVRSTAAQDAAALTEIASRLGRLPNATELRTQLSRLAPGRDNPVCDRRVKLGPGQASAAGGGVAIPCVQGNLGDTKPLSLMLLVAANGQIAATSYPGRFPVGARAASVLAVETVDDLQKGAAAGGVSGRTAQGGVLWALEPVQLTGSGGAAERRLGWVYVQVPAGALKGPSAQDLLALLLPWTSRSGGGRVAQLGARAPLVQLGAALLAVSVLVGLALGLLATGRLRRRLRRLASTTTGMAWGDLQQRALVSGRDEIAEIEDGVNRLAEWLSAELQAGRERPNGAGADAERSQFARELHESVLSELSSLTMLAGGLRKALPSGSPLATGVEAIESTAAGAMPQGHAVRAAARRERPGAGPTGAVRRLPDAVRGGRRGGRGTGGAGRAGRARRAPGGAGGAGRRRAAPRPAADLAAGRHGRPAGRGRRARRRPWRRPADRGRRPGARARPATRLGRAAGR